MDVEAKLRTYDESPQPEIIVKSHWNDNGICGKVVLVIDGKEYTVHAPALERAIKSCTDLK